MIDDDVYIPTIYSIKDAKRYATEAKVHYHEVLKLEENDIETHYQLSLLYLTMLETTLIQSIDNIQSPLAITSVQYLRSMICSGERAITQPPQPNKRTNIDPDDSDYGDEEKNENIVNINYYDYPIGRGIYSPWFSSRIEIHNLYLEGWKKCIIVRIHADDASEKRHSRQQSNALRGHLKIKYASKKSEWIRFIERSNNK